MVKKREFVRTLVGVMCMWAFFLLLSNFRMQSSPQKPNDHGKKDNQDYPAEEDRQEALEKQLREERRLEAQKPYVPDPNAPGELGTPVVVDKTQLNETDQRSLADGWERNAFNEFVSDMISLRRTLKDPRTEHCKRMQWYQPLPSVSIIIVFFNEAWSTLLRTIHSAIDRTNPNLLKELIVVDDFSDHGQHQFRGKFVVEY